MNFCVSISEQWTALIDIDTCQKFTYQKCTNFVHRKLYNEINNFGISAAETEYTHMKFNKIKLKYDFFKGYENAENVQNFFYIKLFNQSKTEGTMNKPKG